MDNNFKITLKKCDDVYSFLSTYTGGDKTGIITFKESLEMFKNKDSLPIVCGVYIVYDSYTGKKGVFQGKNIFENWYEIIKNTVKKTKRYGKISKSYEKHNNLNNITFQIKNILSEYDKDKLENIKKDYIIRLETHINGFNYPKELIGYTSKSNNVNDKEYNYVEKEIIKKGEINNMNSDVNKKLNEIGIFYESLEDSYLNNNIIKSGNIIINKLSNGNIILKAGNDIEKWRNLEEHDDIFISKDMMIKILEYVK